jgi:translation initiation factor 3 subunit H
VLSSYQTVELIETFVNYHENIKKCICIVYDPGLKAIRLRESFIEKFKEQKLTAKELREANITWSEIFQEVPIKIHNPTLIQACIAEYEPDTVAQQNDFDRLNMSMAPFMVQNMESLIECVDDIVLEQQKVSTYHRNVARQAQQQAAWLQKRKAENLARRTAGGAGEAGLGAAAPLQHHCSTCCCWCDAAVFLLHRRV